MAKIIVFSAPSGSGKSTIINYLMDQQLNLHFSISATSRPPRGKEQHGVEYYFLTAEDFRQRIADGEFLEFCEVYEGRYYGTLKAEVDRLLAKGGKRHLRRRRRRGAKHQAHLRRPSADGIYQSALVRSFAPPLDGARYGCPGSN